MEMDLFYLMVAQLESFSDYHKFEEILTKYDSSILLILPSESKIVFDYKPQTFDILIIDISQKIDLVNILPGSKMEIYNDINSEIKKLLQINF